MSSFSIPFNEERSHYVLSQFTQFFGQKVMGHVFETLKTEQQPIHTQIHTLFETALSEARERIPSSELQKEEVMINCVHSYLTVIATAPEFIEDTNFSRFWLKLKMIVPDDLFNKMSRVDSTTEVKRAFLISNQSDLATIKSLDLSELGLTQIPSEISLFTQLEALYLDENDLKELPEALLTLTSLTTLSATYNTITHIPEDFGKLKNLQLLYLFHNQIHSLPDSFCTLENLQIASLGCNQIHSLPLGMEKLAQLEVLILTDNKIKEVSDRLKSMPRLQTLMLDDNLIEHVDKEMFNLDVLTLFTCSSTSKMTTDDTMKKFFLPPLIASLSEEECAQRKKTYWELGALKWKEFIDAEFHHPLGADAFDMPRFSDSGTLAHPGEPGYKQSMINTFEFLSEQWKRPLTAAFYLEIHRHACSHFQGEETNIRATQEDVGQFRGDKRRIQAKFPFMAPHAEAEFERLHQELGLLFGPTFGLGSLQFDPASTPPSCKIHYHPMHKEQIALIFNLFLGQYHHQMSTAASSEDALRAIATLIRLLEWLHPPRDGCGRTDTALMNFLLTAIGMHPVILSSPYRSSFVGLTYWIQILKEEGLPFWEAAVIAKE